MGDLVPLAQFLRWQGPALVGGAAEETPVSPPTKPRPLAVPSLPDARPAPSPIRTQTRGSSRCERSRRHSDGQATGRRGLKGIPVPRRARYSTPGPGAYDVSRAAALKVSGSTRTTCFAGPHSRENRTQTGPFREDLLRALTYPSPADYADSDNADSRLRLASTHERARADGEWLLSPDVGLSTEASARTDDLGSAPLRQRRATLGAQPSSCSLPPLPSWSAHAERGEEATSQWVRRIGGDGSSGTEPCDGGTNAVRRGDSGPVHRPLRTGASHSRTQAVNPATMRSQRAREWAEWLQELRGGGSSGRAVGEVSTPPWASPTYASGTHVVAVPSPGAYHTGVARALPAVGTQHLSGRLNTYKVTFGHGKRFGGPRLYDGEGADEDDWKGQESPGPGAYTGSARDPWLLPGAPWPAPPPRPASSAGDGRVGLGLPSGSGPRVGPGSYDSSEYLRLGRERPPLSGTIRAWGTPMGSTDRWTDALVMRPYYVPAPHTPTETPGVGTYDGAAHPWPGRQHLSTLRNAAGAPISPPSAHGAGRDTAAGRAVGEGGAATMLDADSSFGDQFRSTRASPARPIIGTGPKWDEVSVDAIYPPERRW